MYITDGVHTYVIALSERNGFTFLLGLAFESHLNIYIYVYLCIWTKQNRQILYFSGNNLSELILVSFGI